MHVAQLLNYVKSYTIMEDDKEIKTIKILIPGDFSVFWFFFLGAFSPEICFIQKFSDHTYYHKEEQINPVSPAMIMSSLSII